ncbi:putative Membrane protein [metagenome]|uniref:Putative Membrane protein n=1 Tax=metagenome TaxID=256318 RepID=A0A2P2BY01_9ZZZZ
MPTPPSFRRAPAVAPLVAATACWGVGTVVTKQVLEDVAPLSLLPIQLAASCLLLLTLTLLRREKVTWSPGFRRLAGLGVLNPGLAYALGLLGLVSITASMSVLLWAAEPVLIVLLAVTLLREHVPARRIAALTLAVAGVLLVVYQPGVEGTGLGLALTLMAVGCCALYTVATRQWLLDDASLPVVLAQQMAALAFAAILATAVQAGGGVGWSLHGHGPGVWAAAAVSGCLYYGLAFWFYLIGLRRVDASVAGSYLPLIPVFGVAAGFLVGERLDIHQWLGAATVVAVTAEMALHERRHSPELPLGSFSVDD